MTRALLVNAQQGHTAMARLWTEAKAHLLAGRRMVLELKEETRRDAQNALLHALLTEISRQVKWHGKTLSVDVWKRLCTAAWLRELGESPEMVPALDGKGFDVIFERTSTLTVKQCASLCDWILAFGAEQGVRFTAPEYA